MSWPTLDELTAWRALASAARDVAESPTMRACAHLRSLARLSGALPVPGWQTNRPRLELFAKLVRLARDYHAGERAELAELAVQVERELAAYERTDR